MFSKKSIFVTGAASGIGKQTALYFLQKGWYVGMTDIHEGGLTALQAQVNDQNTFTRKMDVTDFENVKETVDAFLQKTGGRMDVLFNNAGILRMGPFEAISQKDQAAIVDVNFKGVLNCINASFPALRTTKDARIINMSSGSAAYGIPEITVYSATKHAVRGLTEALNIEFEGYDIFVCDIMPAYVATPMVVDAPVKAKSVEKLGIALTPEQVAHTVWKAAHKKKIHWVLGGSPLLSLVLAFLPFLKRPLIKASTGY